MVHWEVWVFFFFSFCNREGPKILYSIPIFWMMFYLDGLVWLGILSRQKFEDTALCLSSVPDVLESSDAILIPKPLKTTCFEACREAVPGFFGTRGWFHGRQIFQGLERVGMTFVSLVSCCVARFLTDHGQVTVRGPGAGDPCFSDFSSSWRFAWWDDISWSESMFSHLSGYSVIPFNLQIAFFSSDNCLRVTSLMIPSSPLVAFWIPATEVWDTWTDPPIVLSFASYYPSLYFICSTL